MKRIIIGVLGLLCGGGIGIACDVPAFHCDGRNPATGELLCYCHSGELCSHDGFAACIDCGVPR
jgi:hypothetical protein